MLGMHAHALDNPFRSRPLALSCCATVPGNVSTTEFLADCDDITAVMNHLDDVPVLKSALPIRAGGLLLGAIDVSGARGAEADEQCASVALEAVAERLEFADWQSAPGNGQGRQSRA